MGIFSRLSDIVNSNINDVLDRAEDPEKIIRLAIQEMEDTLVEARASAAKTIADQKDLQRQLKRMNKAQDSWSEKAELALSKGREDLAKGALIEKRKLVEMIQVMGEELDLLEEALMKHEADIQQLETKLREAKAKQGTLEARHKTATDRVRLKQVVHNNRLEDAFARFDRLERRVDHAEGRAEAYDLGQTKTLDDEIAELAAEEDIQAELDELKAKMKTESNA
ncbi:MAG: phage shock protein PspA [Pseudomonadota bacterium]